MNNKPVVTLIEASMANERLCASAARISTIQGNALDIYERPADGQKDRKLVEKVLLSGHRSLIEHAKFTFAFSDVSVLTEQFFIEFRLASYTIKSRRYVDFSKSGYYTPPGLDEESAVIFRNHMDYLFAEYKAFVDSGIPLEDARFVLPYCFCSNFYCSVNGRELIYMLRTIKYGRGKNISELGEIYRQITAQIESVLPNIIKEITPLNGDSGREIACRFDNIPSSASGVKGDCDLISYTQDAGKVIGLAQTLLETGRGWNTDTTHNGQTLTGYGVKPVGDGTPTLRTFVDETHSASGMDGTENVLDGDSDALVPVQGDSATFELLSPRVIENTSATFMIRNISLSAITHFARHRILTLVIPPFQRVNLDSYVMPESIMENAGIWDRYKRVFEANIRVIKELRDRGFPNELYLCLSGNTLNILTTMNAREYKLFFNLRCCNRAQWEVRSIASDMLRSLRAVQPEIYNQMGPSCYPGGVCPEGKLSCGQSKSVNEMYKALLL